MILSATIKTDRFYMVNGLIDGTLTLKGTLEALTSIAAAK
jgi:hypothetical protein